MVSEKIEVPISFHDGKVLRYVRENDSLVVIVKTWNEKIIEVEFRDVLVVKDMFAITAELQELKALKETDLMQDMLKPYLESGFIDLTDCHELKHFAFYDLDEQKILEILSKQIAITIKN